VPEDRTTKSYFRMFTWYSAIRDFFNPPRNWIAEAGVQAGDAVLDFGFGRGGFAWAAAEVVGPEGKVYALDANPFAVESFQKKAEKKGLAHVEAIHSDGPTGLPDGSVDVALLYDVFHELEAPEAVLAELARVLKPAGTLSFSDHHLKPEEAIAAVRAGGGFQFEKKHKNTLEFAKKA
jgi:ubiquinone/menaquinone biosynthesis C-methylase UbiE